MYMVFRLYGGGGFRINQSSLSFSWSAASFFITPVIISALEKPIREERVPEYVALIRESPSSHLIRRGDPEK